MNLTIAGWSTLYLNIAKKPFNIDHLSTIYSIWSFHDYSLYSFVIVKAKLAF